MCPPPPGHLGVYCGDLWQTCKNTLPFYPTKWHFSDDDVKLYDSCGRMVRDGHGLPKVSPPCFTPMPYPYGRFRGCCPQTACGTLLHPRHTTLYTSGFIWFSSSWFTCESWGLDCAATMNSRSTWLSVSYHETRAKLQSGASSPGAKQYGDRQTNGLTNGLTNGPSLL
jgi:hypothetical protein